MHLIIINKVDECRDYIKNHSKFNKKNHEEIKLLISKHDEQREIIKKEAKKLIWN